MILKLWLTNLPDDITSVILMTWVIKNDGKVGYKIGLLQIT